MSLSISPKHVKRYAQIARLMMKYGRDDLVKEAGLEAALAESDPTNVVVEPKAEELADDLEKLGPTYTKLGQLLSSRVDLLPVAYTDALARLRENVSPFPFEEAKQIVEEELGVRLSKAFSEFEEEPIASASLGQVYRARLQSGRKVAVKVQRPGVRETVLDDFEALGELAVFADKRTEAGRRYHFADVLDEMRRALLQELDYRRESTNLETLKANLAEFTEIVVPAPIEDYTTSKVLTMTFVSGRSVTSLSPMALMEIDGAVLAEELFKAYLKQVLIDGFFHADPHPGNVFITDDGQVGLIDVGMVGRLSPALQDGMLRMLLAMTEGRGTDAADVAIDMGERTELFEREPFRSAIDRLVVDFVTSTKEDIQLGLVVMMLTKTAGDHGLIIPPPLAMLGKTLLNLDLVGRTLDPTFEPNAAIQENASELMQRRLLKNASPSHMLNSLLETNQFIQRLPGRLNRVFDAVEEREFEVNIRVANDSLMLDGMQKIANRIATAAVLAAIILAGALLMSVPTGFRIFGYPGLAMILFLTAAVAALFLFFDVAQQDRQARRAAKRDGNRQK